MIEALGKYKPKDANLAIGLEMVRVRLEGVDTPGCVLASCGSFLSLCTVRRPDLTPLCWNATTQKQVQQQFQPALDAYVARTIPDAIAAESALADATEWDDRWPEPLETYAPILRMARDKGYTLLALGMDSEALSKVQAVGLEGLSEQERGKYVADPSGFIQSVKLPSFKLYAERFILPAFAARQQSQAQVCTHAYLHPTYFHDPIDEPLCSSLRSFINPHIHQHTHPSLPLPSHVNIGPPRRRFHHHHQQQQGHARQILSLADFVGRVHGHQGRQAPPGLILSPCRMDGWTTERRPTHLIGPPTPNTHHKHHHHLVKQAKPRDVVVMLLGAEHVKFGMGTPARLERLLRAVSVFCLWVGEERWVRGWMMNEWMRRGTDGRING